MGNKWEVCSYEKYAGSWGYVTMYRGESFLKALWTMRTLKKLGVGCVKLEWR